MIKAGSAYGHNGVYNDLYSRQFDYWSDFMDHKRSIGVTLWMGLTVILAACQATPTEVITDIGPESCQDRILIEVWNDLDGDGEWDEPEPPVEGALIILARQDDPQQDNIQTQTNSEGQAYFGGFEMAGCDPLGYQILFARSVSGFAFPQDPAVDLNNFDMLEDVVQFGLLED
jgi:hypothetical protein